MKKLMLLSACLAAGLMLVIGCAKGTPSEPDLPAATATTTCTQTFTPQNTASVTPTSTVTASVTETSTATETVTVTPSVTPTFTVTGTFTVTRTVTPTRTATPTLTPYPTVAAEVPGADYPFSSASEINGWDGIGACSVSGYSAVDYYDPAGAMEISWDGSGNTYGLIRHAFGAVTDLTGNVLSFYIKCPPEMKDYQINISLYSTSAGGGRFVGVINGTGYWQHMTWDLGAAPPCCGTDPAQITELHIMVNSAGQQADIPGAKLYIDSVDFNY